MLSLGTIILTLFSSLSGGFLRALPELIALWNKKTDNSHELNMLDKQIELEKQKGANRTAEIDHQHVANMGEIEAKGSIDSFLKGLELQREALKGQMQKTGIRMVDALNFLVRPVTTYYFLALHGFAKMAMFVIAYRANLDQWEAILKIWGPEDIAILSMILSFWFVGRVFDKKQ